MNWFAIKQKLADFCFSFSVVVSWSSIGYPASWCCFSSSSSGSSADFACWDKQLRDCRTSFFFPFDIRKFSNGFQLESFCGDTQNQTGFQRWIHSEIFCWLDKGNWKRYLATFPFIIAFWKLSLDVEKKAEAVSSFLLCSVSYLGREGNTHLHKLPDFYPWILRDTKQSYKATIKRTRMSPH